MFRSSGGRGTTGLTKTLKSGFGKDVRAWKGFWARLKDIWLKGKSDGKVRAVALAELRHDRA